MTAHIFVTSQPNDDDLARALGSIAVRAPIEHGDAVFFGKWQEDVNGSVSISDVRVLIERKHVRDMTNCILTGRYLHQAQQAKEAGFDHIILIVEDDICASRDGMLMVKRPKYVKGKGGASFRSSLEWQTSEPRIAYSRFDQYLDELALFCGIPVKRSSSVAETASQIKNLWLLFQRPPSEHKALEIIYDRPAPRVDLLRKPSVMRRIAEQLDGIGWEKSKAVERHFHSIRTMFNADEKEWQKVPGVGKKIAQDVVTAVTAIRR